MRTIANNPRIVKKLINSTLEGKSAHQIASDMGVNQTTVSRTLSKPVVRALLEKAYLDLASLAPEVYTAYSDELRAIPTGIDERKLRLAAAKDVSGMIGLSPVRDSHNNVFFTQIVAPIAIQLSPLVASLLHRIAQAPSEDGEDSIDVDYSEE